MKIILIGRGEIFYKVYLYLYNRNYLKLVIFDNKTDISKPRFYNLIKKKFKNSIIATTINNQKITSRIKNINFDYILSVNNHLIFNDDFLKTFKNKIINYHNSLIPNFKGLHSVSKAIISGQDQTGISWHLVTKKVDDGPVIFSKTIKILKHDTAASLTLKCNSTCIKYIEQFLSILRKKKKFKFKKNRKVEDFKLSHKILHLKKSLKLSYLDRIVKAFNYYPFKSKFGHPFVYFDKKKIFIRKIIFYSKNKYSCQKYINRDCILIKFTNMYVVFKKLNAI